MTNSIARADGSKWIDPKNRKSVWRWSEAGKQFRMDEPGRIAWLPEDDPLVPTLVPYDPGERVIHERQLDRAANPPDMKAFQKILDLVRECPDEIFGPGNKEQWLAVRLNHVGCDLKFKKDSNVVINFSGTWEQYDSVWNEIQRRCREHAEKNLPALLKKLRQTSSQMLPSKQYSSKEYESQYKDLTAWGKSKGIEGHRCLFLWGETMEGDSVNFAPERLVRYKAKLEAEVAKGAKVDSVDVDEGVHRDGNDAVDSTDGGGSVQELVSAVDGLPDQGDAAVPEGSGTACDNAGSSGDGGGDRQDLAALVGEENVEWFLSQETDYQEYFQTAMTPEERAEELANVAQMRSKQTTQTVDASAVTESDAGCVSESVSVNTVSITPLEQRRNELIKTDEGYIVDADGVVINDETAFVLLGLSPDFTIATREDIEIVAGKMNDLQKRINRRCGMFLRKTMPLFTAHQAAMRWYRAQLRRYGEENLPKWEKDSREGVKKPHQKGDYKAKSLKLDEGIVYYRSAGGWKVENEGAVKAQILREMRLLDINALLPDDIREKYGARLELSFSRKKAYALAEAGFIREGMKHEPIDPIGKIGFGDEDSNSMWTPDGICALVRRGMKQVLCAFKGIEMKEDAQEEDDE